MFKKALLATDFSETSKNLPQCLFALCPDVDTEVILAHVTEGDTSSNGISYKTAMEDLAALKTEIEQAGYAEVSIAVSSGTPCKEIDFLARQAEADIVLASSHGKRFLRSTLLGSTTFDLSRMATYPLFIEKIYKETDNQVGLLHKIMLPTDFSKQSLVSLSVIRSLREHIDEVIFVHVIEHSRSDEELEQKQAQAQQKLDELVEEMKMFGVPASYRIEKGSPSKRLRALAEELDASLVIMAKRGSGIIQGLLLGSTSQNFALNSDRPLLLMPMEDEEIE